MIPASLTRSTMLAAAAAALMLACSSNRDSDTRTPGAGTAPRRVISFMPPQLVGRTKEGAFVEALAQSGSESGWWGALILYSHERKSSFSETWCSWGTGAPDSLEMMRLGNFQGIDRGLSFAEDCVGGIHLFYDDGSEMNHCVQVPSPTGPFASVSMVNELTRSHATSFSTKGCVIATSIAGESPHSRSVAVWRLRDSRLVEPLDRFDIDLPDSAAPLSMALFWEVEKARGRIVFLTVSVVDRSLRHSITLVERNAGNTSALFSQVLDEGEALSIDRPSAGQVVPRLDVGKHRALVVLERRAGNRRVLEIQGFAVERQGLARVTRELEGASSSVCFLPAILAPGNDEVHVSWLRSSESRVESDVLYECFDEDLQTISPRTSLARTLFEPADFAIEGRRITIRNSRIFVTWWGTSADECQAWMMEGGWTRQE